MGSEAGEVGNGEGSGIVMGTEFNCWVELQVIVSVSIEICFSAFCVSTILWFKKYSFVSSVTSCHFLGCLPITFL